MIRIFDTRVYARVYTHIHTHEPEIFNGSISLGLYNWKFQIISAIIY